MKNVGGDCLKRRELGQFADLRRGGRGGGGLARKRGGVFEGVNTPMHTIV